MQIYPEAEPFTHLAKVPFGVKQYMPPFLLTPFLVTPFLTPFPLRSKNSANV